MDLIKFVTVIAGTKAVIPVSLDFSTLGDGALPSPLTGATWAISGGKAINTPTETPVTVTDGGLENWASATDLTSWTEEIAGTSTVNQDTDAGDIHGGSSAARLDVDASNSLARIYQGQYGHTVGDWWAIRAWLKASAAGKTAKLGINNGAPNGFSHVLTTSLVQYMSTCRSTTFVGAQERLTFERTAGTSASLFVDDFTAAKLTLATMFAWMDAKQANVTVKGAWILTNGALGGVIINLDNPTTPLNFVYAYHTGPDGDTISLFKCVAGVYSNVLVNQSAAYVEGANVEVRKTASTTYQLWYNGAQIGADQTISDAGIISNTYHGLFGTGGIQANSFFVG